MVKIIPHAQERIEERFDNDIHFRLWFKDALKRSKKGKGWIKNVMIEKYNSGEKDGRYGLWYNFKGGVQFIYDVRSTCISLITTYSAPKSKF